MWALLLTSIVTVTTFGKSFWTLIVAYQPLSSFPQFFVKLPHQSDLPLTSAFGRVISKHALYLPLEHKGS
jgi:hypothetical protein